MFSTKTYNSRTRKVDFLPNITIKIFCVKPETPCRWWLWTFPYNYIIRHFVSWMPPPTKNVYEWKANEAIFEFLFHQIKSGLVVFKQRQVWSITLERQIVLIIKIHIISLIRSKYANLLYLTRKGQLCIIGQLCWVGWIIFHCYVK